MNIRIRDQQQEQQNIFAQLPWPEPAIRQTGLTGNENINFPQLTYCQQSFA